MLGPRGDRLMGWFKIDDQLFGHPKVLSIDPRRRLAAIGLFTLAGSWSSAHLTDGVIPEQLVSSMQATRKQCESLVSAGLWDVHPQGYVFHDWADYNPTRAEVLAKRQVRAAAGKIGGEHSASKRASKVQANASPPGKQSPSKCFDHVPTPVPARPDPTTTAPTVLPPASPNGTALVPVVESLNQRAQRLTKTYRGLEPMSNFAAILGIIKKAMAAGYSDAEIIPALERLARDGRGVTTETLRVELQGLPAPRGQPKRSTTDERVMAGLELAAKYEEQEKRNALEGGEHYENSHCIRP
jgi:hypothetical protein